MLRHVFFVADIYGWRIIDCDLNYYYYYLYVRCACDLIILCKSTHAVPQWLNGVAGDTIDNGLGQGMMSSFIHSLTYSSLWFRRLFFGVAEIYYC